MAYSRKIFGRMALAAALSLAFAIPSWAQVPGGGGGGSGGGGGFGGGVGMGGGGGGGRIGGGAGGGGLGGGGAGGAGALNNLGTGAVGNRTTGGGSSAPSASNFLSGYYSYPYVTALPPVDTGAAQRTATVQTAVSHTVPPFGGQTFTATTTGARAGGGAARGAATVRGGGMGARTTIEGFDAEPSGSPNGVRLPRYSTAIRFSTTPVSSERVQSEVQDVIARSTRLPSRAQIVVQVAGRDVILRGNVTSQEESRQAEALVRMTPGVGMIINELTYSE